MYLSIIVPVYNVEAYLRKCVDSLLDQNIPQTDYEILLIDDGSTDNSGQLCEALAASIVNIRTIHQQNMGLGVARNTGIAAASGEYIQFVDSDDFLCPNVLSGILHQLKNQDLDILRVNYQNVNTAGEVFEPNKYSKPFDDFSEEVCNGMTFLNERLGFACYAVQFVVKASLLRREGNGFKEGIYFEDVEWTPRILPQAKRVASCPTMVYNYLYRQNSIARNQDTDRKRKSVEDRIQLIGTLKGLESGTEDCRWVDGMVAQTVLSVISVVGRCFYPDRKRYIGSLKRLRVFPLSSYHATASAAKKIRVANFSPELLCCINHFKKRN